MNFGVEIPLSGNQMTIRAKSNFYCIIGKDITELEVIVNVITKNNKHIDFDLFVEYLKSIEGTKTTREMFTKMIFDDIQKQINPEKLEVETTNISKKNYVATVKITNRS